MSTEPLSRLDQFSKAMRLPRGARAGARKSRRPGEMRRAEVPSALTRQICDGRQQRSKMTWPPPGDHVGVTSPSTRVSPRRALPSGFATRSCQPRAPTPSGRAEKTIGPSAARALVPAVAPAAITSNTARTPSASCRTTPHPSLVPRRQGWVKAPATGVERRPADRNRLSTGALVARKLGAERCQLVGRNPDHGLEELLLADGPLMGAGVDEAGEVLAEGAHAGEVTLRDQAAQLPEAA